MWPIGIFSLDASSDDVMDRLWKEHNMYRQEALQLKAKLDKLVADGADEYDIKNAVGHLLSVFCMCSFAGGFRKRYWTKEKR
jgi:hypothetical protein